MYVIGLSWKARNMLTGAEEAGLTTSVESNPDANMRMLWFATLALLCTIHVIEGANPGLKARVTQAGLDYARQVGLDTLKDLVNTMRIDDLTSGTLRTSNIQIQEFQIPQSAVSFSPGTGISLSVSNANIKITGNWRIKKWLFSDSGSFEVSVSDLSSSAVIGVTSGEGGRPSVSNARSNFNIGSLRLKLRGGGSWLYNLFKKVMERKLKDILTNKLNEAYQKAITNMEQVLKTMKISARVDQIVEIDYSLVNPPTFTNNYMDLDCKGAFYYSASRSDPPFSPASLSFPDQSNRMLYVAISDYFTNSAGYAYYSAGFLQIDVMNSRVLRDQGFNLTTESFEDFLPEVPNRYPNAMVKLQISARKQPTVSFLPGKLELAAYGTLQASAVLPNSELATIFQMDLDVILNIKVSVSASRLSMFLTLKSFNLSQVSSSFGSFEVHHVQPLLTAVLDRIVLPKVNEKLFDGFPLPTFDKLVLVNPTVTINEGHVLISTDMQYSRQ